ncbi:hypothetical protein ABLO27_07005 [Roseibium sp. SCPC15]|uniref:hypothetical protein n=1 Tax=Roseibium sp. SCP15 TaxID=3141376 RepID=UPI00333578CC
MSIEDAIENLESEIAKLSKQIEDYERGDKKSFAYTEGGEPVDVTQDEIVARKATRARWEAIIAEFKSV